MLILKKQTCKLGFQISGFIDSSHGDDLLSLSDFVNVSVEETTIDIEMLVFALPFSDNLVRYLAFQIHK